MYRVSEFTSGNVDWRWGHPAVGAGFGSPQIRMIRRHEWNWTGARNAPLQKFFGDMIEMARTPKGRPYGN